MSSRSGLAQVDAARREGRLETVTQRQKEITAIHAAVRSSAGELRDELLAADSTRTEVDVLVETTVALQMLVLIFDQLSLKASIAEEQLPQQGKSNEGRHDALGTVLILSNGRLPLSSALVPMTYAIAAGNSTIVVLSPDLPAFSKKLYAILNESGLDREAIELLNPESRSDREQILSELSSIPIHAVFTQGDAEAELARAHSFHKLNHNVRLTLAGTDVNLAIVTRNANVQLAAKEILRANFGYGTTPAAAPGVVLVDEFVTRSFFESLQKDAQDSQMRLQHSTKLMSKQEFDGMRAFIEGFKRQGGRAVEVGDAKVILIGNPNWKSMEPYESILAAKRSKSDCSGILCLVPTTSLEAAISLSVQINSNDNMPSLFIFANPSETRYLAQFVPSSATYLNHIPLVALFAPSPHLPVKSMLNEVFAKPHPILGKPSTMLPIPDHIFEQPADSLIASLNSLLVVHTLGPPKQKSGKQTGFFAQGALVGLSHLFIGLAVVSYTLMYLRSWAVGRLSY